jgi:hypothetical protein
VAATKGWLLMLRRFSKPEKFSVLIREADD